MCPTRKVILLEDQHDRAARRCSLAHAVAHIDLKHRATNGLISNRQELAADQLASRRLINMPALVGAALWAESFEEVAAELDVDKRMLFVRIRHLHPSERGALLRGLDVKMMSA